MTRQAAALFHCERMPVLSAVQYSGGAMTAAERSAEADVPVSGSRERFLLHGRSADNAAAPLPRGWRIMSPAVAFDGGTAAAAERDRRRLGCGNRLRR